MNSPYYLLFDFETTGIGFFKQQRAIQLAWMICNDKLQIFEKKNFFISEQTEINTNFHTDLSIDFLNKNGKKIEHVLNIFLEDIEVIIKNNGKLVAHNIDFDLSILFNEIRLSEIKYNRNMLDLMNYSFCTMVNSVNLCKINSHAFNGKKYPRLVELYKHFFKKNPQVELHKADNDVEILYACLYEIRKIRKI